MSGGDTSWSACLVLYESRPLLPAFLEALESQTRPPSERFACVNGPDDGSAAWLRERGFRVFEEPDNPGFGAAANRCLEACASPWAMILNPDLRLAPDCAERLLAAGSEEGAVAVGPLLLRPAGEGEGERRIDSAGFRVQPWLRIVDMLSGRPLSEAPTGRRRVPGLCGAALMLRRDALADAGIGFDESFWMYKEDQDLALRIAAAGGTNLLEPAARAEHDRGWAPGGRGAIAPELRASSLANRWLLLLIHWSRLRELWRLPLVLAFELLLPLVLLPSEPGTWTRALGLLRRRWSAARRARAEVASLRERGALDLGRRATGMR